MKESVKTFCRINGVEASESLAETLFNAYMESVANDDREHPTEFNNAGDKNKLQFPRELREQFERDCGFTDEELKIFRLRAKGMSVLQISFAMQTDKELYGTEKVERRIRAIKDKIAAAIE